MKVTRWVAVAALLALLAAGCSRPGPGDLELAVRGVALDLAFEDDELVEPVEPEQIIRFIPAPSVRRPADLLSFTGDRPLPEPPPLPNPCPEAPPGAAPKVATSVRLTDPPAPGRYERFNRGQFTVSGTIVDITLPYPFFTADVVGEATVTPRGEEEKEIRGAIFGQESPDLIDWDVVEEITSDIDVTTSYHLTEAALQIVKRVFRNGDQIIEFVPQPAINFFEVNQGEGHEWSSAGVDPATNIAMQIEGRIERRAAVDVCGELIDTFEFVTQEFFVDLSTGQTRGTTEEGNRYNIATQFGGIIVETDKNYTELSREPESGALLEISYDFVSTLLGVEPR